MTKIKSLEQRNPDPLYSIPASSDYLGGVAQFSIREWIREGKLPACHVQGRVFVRQSSLDAFIKDGYRPRPYRRHKPRTQKPRKRGRPQ